MSSELDLEEETTRGVPIFTCGEGCHVVPHAERAPRAADDSDDTRLGGSDDDDEEPDASVTAPSRPSNSVLEEGEVTIVTADGEQFDLSDYVAKYCSCAAADLAWVRFGDAGSLSAAKHLHLVLACRQLLRRHLGLFGAMLEPGRWRESELGRTQADPIVVTGVSARIACELLAIASAVDGRASNQRRHHGHSGSGDARGGGELEIDRSPSTYNEIMRDSVRRYRAVQALLRGKNLDSLQALLEVATYLQVSPRVVWCIEDALVDLVRSPDSLWRLWAITERSTSTRSEQKENTNMRARIAIGGDFRHDDDAVGEDLRDAVYEAIRRECVQYLERNFADCIQNQRAFFRLPFELLLGALNAGRIEMPRDEMTPALRAWCAINATRYNTTHGDLLERLSPPKTLFNSTNRSALLGMLRSPFS